MRICHRVVQALGSSDRDITLAAGRHSLVVSRLGLVRSVDDIVDQLNPRIRDMWISYNSARGEAALWHVVKFVCCARNSTDATKSTRNILDRSFYTIMQCVIAPHFEDWVFNVYGAVNDLSQRPRILRHPRTRRLSGGVGPHTVWDCLQESRALWGTGSNRVRTVLRSDHTDIEELSVTGASRWCQKELVMYEQQKNAVLQKVSK